MLELIKNTLKQSSIYALGSVASSAVSFLLIPVYTRYLTPADYGVLAILTLFISICSILIPMGMGSALFIRYFNESEDKREVVVSTAATFILISAVIFSSIVFFASSYISVWLLGSVEFKRYFSLISGIVFFDSAIIVPLALFRIREEPLKYAGLNILKLLSTIAFNIYFVVFLKKGVLGILYGTFLGSSISWLLIFPFLIIIRYRFRFDIIQLKKLLRLALPIAYAILMSWIISSSDRYILKLYHPLTEVGLYDLGYKLGRVINILLIVPFSTAWAVIMFKIAEKKDAGRIFSKFLTYYYCSILFIGFSISVFAKEIIEVVATPAFLDSYKVIPIITLSHILGGTYYFWTFGPALKNLTKEYIATSCAVFTNLALNFLLIPKFGMMGAAYATVISYLVMALVMLYYSNKYYFVKYEYKRVFLFTIACFLLFLISLQFDDTRRLIQYFLNFVLILLLPATLYLFNFFDNREKLFILSLLKKVTRREHQ